MAIISISLADESVSSLDAIQEYLDLKGRSEAVRTSIRMAEAELKEMEKLDGDVEGVLIIVHSTHDDQWMNKIQHRHEKNIRTQLHSHLQNRKCLEVMILSGEASAVRDMIKDIYAVGKADYIKFVRSR